MTLPEKAKLLRIYVGEDDRCDGRPLFEAIVVKARRLNMAGATVLRSPMGFGASSRIHTEKILRLSEDLPVVIEIVDREDRIKQLIEELGTMMNGGLVTMESVEIVRYESGR